MASTKNLEKRDAKICQIRAELEAGQLRSALLRVKGLVTTFPLASAVRDVAGQAHWQAGELLSAGLHWSLSDRRDTIANECIERFTRFHGSDVNVFEAYKFRELPFGKADSMAVNEELAQLKERLDVSGYSFGYLTPRPHNSSNWSRAEIIIVIVLVSAVLVFLAGVFQIISWVVG